MTLELEVLSEKKGSNPGGKAKIPCLSSFSQFYFKYCNRSSLPSCSSLRPVHQPIYEALTCVLANKLGLHTPKNYVLLGGDVNFSGDASLLKKLDTNRPFYFLSEFISLPTSEDINRAKVLMERESVYRDLLLVSDIVGRKQNYVFFDNLKGGELVYLDLGCNFVHATDGRIFFRNDVLHHAFNNDFKKEVKMLHDYYLIPANQNADDFINLGDFTSINPSIKIPFINSRNCRRDFLEIGSVLSTKELAEISTIFAYELVSNLKELKKSQFIIRAG
jgi:hypothetical protein